MNPQKTGLGGTGSRPRRTPLAIQPERAAKCNASRGVSAFTLLELLAVTALLCLWAAAIVPGLARTQGTSKAIECQNNLRQLTTAWRQWSDAHNDTLLHTGDAAPRPTWITGVLDLSGANLANWDVNHDVARSPLWRYVGGTASVFRCPADPSTVVRSTDGRRVPRVRSYSMNSVFGFGEWLNGSYNPYQTRWRLYAKGAEIMAPTRTFVAADEHPGSMNDACLNVACTGAETNDPTNTAKIIDFPASSHAGAGSFSFADGHVVGHRWVGSRIRPPFDGSLFGLAVAAEDSWIDARWLAQNTTVRR